MSWDSGDFPDILSPGSLRETASWIRDDLDPLIAREGPHKLHPDDVLTLHTVLLTLQQYKLPLYTIRFSRIHLAVAEICGKATRWPTKLANEADHVLAYLGKIFGRLNDIRTPLFERGGRLHGICEPKHITRDSLLHRFAEENPGFVDNSRAYNHTSLGFQPGQWWINGMFAFRDGIIDDKCTDGGLCYDDFGAYAIVMKDTDEDNSPSPDSFTYRCHGHDRGRFRLTSANFRSRYPVRVLRSHTLASFWAPKAGLRYDGLHRVTGWTVRPVNPDEHAGLHVMYDVHFERDDDTPWDRVLSSPLAEDIDDYEAYKISNREQRDAERQSAQKLDSINRRSAQIFALSTVPEPEHSESFQRGDYRYKDGTINMFDEVPITRGVNKRMPSMTRMDRVATERVNIRKQRTLDDLIDGEEEHDMRGCGVLKPIPSNLTTLQNESSNGVQTKQAPKRMQVAFTTTEPLPPSLSKKRSPHQRSYDGSYDEPLESTAIALRPRTPANAQSATTHPGQPSILTEFKEINWNPPPCFKLVDWNPPPCVTIALDPPQVVHAFGSASKFARRTEDSSISSRSYDNTTTGPVNRAVFEQKRRLVTTPQNAAAFLQAQSRVWVDLTSAEYVDMQVAESDNSIGGELSYR